MARKKRGIRGEVCSETKHTQDVQDDNTVVYKQYSRYQHKDLIDERWRKKRRAVIAKAKYKCQHCGVKNTRFDVHHIYYVKNKRLWQYPYKALLVLCRDCHTKWHEEHRLEYREEIWSDLNEYQAPKNRKIYFVTKGRKLVKKEVPYKRLVPKVTGTAQQPLTPLQKAKQRIKKKVKKNGKFSFSPIPEWRMKQKTEQV